MLNVELIPKGEPILVAVSGGSDSMALLTLLLAKGAYNVQAATVDHGLRPKARQEAQKVAEFCQSRSVLHKTLVWTPDKRSSAAARNARYELLAEHARSIGASTILLGHTVDDQAETVLMRARRMNEHSDTRGLAGMTATTSYDGLHLVRPLLEVSRTKLREYLKDQTIEWIEDPSNVNMNSERVRIRNEISTSDKLPPPDQLARLASLSSRTRQWINLRVSKTIAESVTVGSDGLVTFAPDITHTPTEVAEVFATLTLCTGGQGYRVRAEKFVNLIDQMKQGRSQRMTIGRCLITSRNQRATFRYETRLPKKLARSAGATEFFQSESGPQSKPAIDLHALQRFRPAIDDVVHEALLQLADRTNVQHKARN